MWASFSTFCSGAYNTVLDLTYPELPSAHEEPREVRGNLCHHCGEPFSNDYQPVEGVPFICHDCSSLTWHFEQARAGFRMAGEVRAAIAGFKYEHENFRRGQLVTWLTACYDRFYAGSSFTHVVPVPLHPVRHRERGFNQAYELGRGLVKARPHLQLWPALRRVRYTASQASLGRDHRLENLKHAFHPKAGFDVQGLDLLILDDVFTTGATAEACAQVLAQQGAARLAVLTIARS